MSVVFYLVFIAGSYIEFKVWRRVTPSMLSFVGIFFISTCYDLMYHSSNYILVNDEVYIYLSLFYFSSLIASLSCAYILMMIRPDIFPLNSQLENTFSYSQRSVECFIVFVLVVVIYSTYGVYRAYNSVGNLFGEEFEHILSAGLIGHAFVFVAASIPFLFLFAFRANISKKTKTFTVLLLIYVLLILFIKQIKYWVLVPIIWMFLITLSLQAKYSVVLILKRVSAVLIFGFSLFILVYMLPMILTGTIESFFETVMSIINHFFGYLFSGLLVFSSLADDGYFNELTVHSLFHPFRGVINIVNLVLYQDLYYEKGIAVPFYLLNTQTGVTGNVPTLWGSFLLYMGALSFIIYFVVMFLMTMLFAFSYRYGSIFIIYTCIVSFLVLSWFASYFSLLSIYELPSISLMMYLCLRLFGKKKPMVDEVCLKKL